MRHDAWAGTLVWRSCQSPVAYSCGLLNHLNSFCRGMFKLNTKFDADPLPHLLNHFECDDHTVHMLTQWYLQPLLTSTVKLSFKHVRSSPLFLLARLHQYHTNRSRYINGGWMFFRTDFIRIIAQKVWTCGSVRQGLMNYAGLGQKGVGRWVRIAIPSPSLGPWLWGDIGVTLTVLSILTMAGLFLDIPWYMVPVRSLCVFKDRNCGILWYLKTWGIWLGGWTQHSVDQCLKIRCCVLTHFIMDTSTWALQKDNPPLLELYQQVIWD